MLSYNELKPGVFIVLNGQPFAVLESEFLRMQQRKPVMKTKLKNLTSGSVVERSFQPSDQLEEAEMEKIQVKFLYINRGEVWFCDVNNPKNRFQIGADIIAGKEINNRTRLRRRIRQSKNFQRQRERKLGSTEKTVLNFHTKYYYVVI